MNTEKTGYDAIRCENMLRHGFGPEVMKRIKVCGVCGTQNAAKKRRCRKCGSRLSRNTLFDRYREKHRSCPVCKTVLPDAAEYCPICGWKLTMMKP